MALDCAFNITVFHRLDLCTVSASVYIWSKFDAHHRGISVLFIDARRGEATIFGGDTIAIVTPCVRKWKAPPGIMSESILILGTF